MGKQTHDQTVLPPQDLEAMLDLSRFLEHHPEPAALLGPDGQVVALPLEVFRALESVVSAMREGKAITIAPVDQVLTTREAADARLYASDIDYTAALEAVRQRRKNPI